MRRSLLAAFGMFVASPALAAPPAVPPGAPGLVPRNALSEILSLGSVSQAAARANLGLLGMAMQDSGAVAITGGSANLNTLSMENTSTAATTTKPDTLASSATTRSTQRSSAAR